MSAGRGELRSGTKEVDVTDEPEAKDLSIVTGASKRLITVRVLQQFVIRAILELDAHAQLTEKTRDKLEQARRGKF